ncbi:MAG: nucleotidyltransferase domain-containing protein [Candidatus Falkowbacteria bacterium]
MDIFNLGKSKLRRGILNLYFSHSEKKYYLRELERLFKKPVAYIRREMLALEKAGLFNSEFQGKQKYFSLNEKFPLYKELEKIVSKTIGLEKNLADSLAGLKNIEVAFVFGSFAKGDQDGLSDIDLMIIGRPDEDKLIAAISRLEADAGREINYHIFSRNDLTKKIKEKNSFIKSVISHPKLFLIGNEKSLSKFN